jgi:hypothetical protein
MNRKELQPKILQLIEIYSSNEPVYLSNKILDLICEAEGKCSHNRKTRTSDEYVYCFECDNYIFMPDESRK